MYLLVMYVYTCYTSTVQQVKQGQFSSKQNE